MKHTATMSRTAITLDTVVDFVRDWIKSILDDVVSLSIGMIVIALCMAGIFYTVSYQDEIIVWLVARTLTISPALTVNQTLAVIGAAIYFMIALTVSIAFSISGFHAHRSDILDSLDELLSRIEESELEEETARELIAAISDARKRG